MSTLRVIFAGGGTGGHLFPAIAIAEEIKKQVPDATILFIGTKDKIEARVVPQKGFQFETIWISGFQRGLRIKNFIFPLKVVISLMQAYSIIKYFQPDVVIGTGGYVSGPVLRAAILARIPTLIHEQNSYPGVTTRLLAPKVNEVHLTFESSKRYFHDFKNIYVTGNPTREDLESAAREEALAYFGFEASEHKAIVLIFGGSLGAHSINEAVENCLDKLINNNVRLIWQTGKEDYEHVIVAAKKLSPKMVWVSPFIDRMDYAYCASDLVVCRAGATTIAEITRLGKPAILVPYPHAAANHQFENAKSLVDAGAAEMLNDSEINDKLFTTILNTLTPERLSYMGEQSKKLGKPDASKILAQRIINLART